MFPKSKRFQDPAPQAPPVGLYDIKTQKQSVAPGFGKGKRFAEFKDTGPGPASNNSLLDISSCSTSSRNDSKCSQFVSPLPLRKSRKISSSTPNPKGDTSLENEVLRLLSEKAELENELYLAQQQVQDLEEQFQSLLQEKVCHESSIADLQKEVECLIGENRQLLTKVQENPSKSVGSIEILEEELKSVKLQVQDKEGVISTLKLQLSCALENSRADLEMEQERNKALNERIASLERTVAEVVNDRDEVEEANQRLHELVAHLRNENIQLNEKLERTEETLEDIRAKMDTTISESQNKIYALEEMLSKEMTKSKELGDKLERSMKQIGDNFNEAQSRITQFQKTNGNLESKNKDLEAKVLEMIERAQCAEDKARYLSAEKLSLDSRLEKCERDYEQRLSIASDQVESLQQELQRNEELMTQNLRSLTGKYEDLEESYTCFQTEAEKEKQLILAELEVTKDSLQKSRQESEQQQNTCVFLKRQSEQLQEKCDELNLHLESLKAEADSMRNKLSQCEQEKGAAKSEVEATRIELQKNLEETEQAKASLRKSLDEAHNTINDLHQQEESLTGDLQRMLSNQKEQEEELETVKNQMNRAKCETEEAESRLKREVERYQSEANELKEILRETKEDFTRQLKALEEKAAKSKEEFGRRLVETQKKLSQTEINFEKYRTEQEMKVKHSNMEMERKLFTSLEEVNRLKSELSSNASNDDQLNEYKAQMEIWRSKYENLWQKIEPFKDQLDEYEAERKALLCQNSRAKDEVAKLGQQYAKLLGHQNMKQKIQHVVKLKEENIALKSEITKLREQSEKQKRSMKKLEEKLDQSSGKKRFNPADAFTHAKKENMPLSVISNGNGSIKS